MKITNKNDIVLFGSVEKRKTWDNTAEAMVVHHSAYRKTKMLKQFFAINDWHKKRWPKFISSMGWHIGYNFIIEDGEIHQARAVGEELAAHRGFNTKYLATCFSGDYRYDELSQADREAFKRLMDMIQELFDDSKHLPLKRHSEVSSKGTECPAGIDVPALAEFIKMPSAGEVVLGNNRLAMIKAILEKLLRILTKLVGENK